MNVRNSPAWSANFVLLYLFFAVVLAWLWKASSVQHTHPWLIRGDTGGPAILALCGVSILPAVLVWGVVVLCDRTDRATKALGFLSTSTVLLTAVAVLLLFVLPYYSTGG